MVFRVDSVLHPEELFLAMVLLKNCTIDLAKIMVKLQIPERKEEPQGKQLYYRQ